MLFSLNRDVKALFSAFRCRESTVNSSPKGVEEISIFTVSPNQIPLKSLPVV